MKIEYIVGDATAPVTPMNADNLIIAHCCNDVGAWGSGFVVPLGNKYPNVKYLYGRWAKSGFFHNDEGKNYTTVPHNYQGIEYPFKLGQVQLVKTEINTVYVANMIGQRDCGYQTFQLGRRKIELPAIRYDSIYECLCRLGMMCKALKAEVHCPMFGAGLAGGDWAVIEGMLNKLLITNNIPVFVYELPKKA